MGHNIHLFAYFKNLCHRKNQRNGQSQSLCSNLIYQPAINHAKCHQTINASLENIIWQQVENKWLSQIDELKIESSPTPKTSIFKEVDQKSY
jgi:hypothetical protein